MILVVLRGRSAGVLGRETNLGRATGKALPSSPTSKDALVSACSVVACVDVPFGEGVTLLRAASAIAKIWGVIDDLMPIPLNLQLQSLMMMSLKVGSEL